MTENRTEKELPDNLTENIIEVYLIRSLCLIKILPSYVYLNSINKRSSILIIDSLIGHIPPINCRCEIFEMQRNWFLHCLRQLIDPTGISQFDFLKFCRTIFQRANKSYSKNIINFINRKLRYLNNPNQNLKAEFNSQQDEVNLFASFFSVYSDNPALFYSIRYFKINDNPIFPTNFQFPGSEGRLIAAFGNRIFECCSTIPPILLRASKYEDIADLFGLPSIFSSEDGITAAQQVQLAFFTVHKFPRLSFFGDEYNHFLSLINSSLVFNTMFVDLLFLSSFDMLLKTDYQNFVALYKDFLFDCIDIPMLAIFDKGKDKDLEYLTRIISIHFDNTQNISNTPFTNLLNDIFEMLRDVLILVQEAKDLTGMVISIDLLSRQSCPNIFRSFLESENEEPFQKMRQKHPFLYSPIDWSNDNDFVSSYFSLLYSVQLITTGNEELYDSIAFHLGQINNKDIVNSVSIDIFSLLFLKSSDDALFIPKDRAEMLLRVLIDTDNEDDRVNELYNYLRHGIRKLQFATILFPDVTTVEGIMHSDEEIFLCALEQKESAILSTIAHENATKALCTPKKAQLVNQIYDFISHKNNPSNLLNETKVEILCSLELTKDELSSFDLNSIGNVDDSVKNLLDNRLNNHNLSLFDQNSLSPSNDIVEKFSEKSFQSSTWEVSMSNENSFEGRFVHFLDTIIPPLLLSEPNLTVYDCLKMDQKKSLICLINDRHFDEADKLAQSIACDPIDILLNGNDCNENSLDFIARKNPVISACQLFQNSAIKTNKYFNDSRPLNLSFNSLNTQIDKDPINESLELMKNKTINIQELSDSWYKLTEKEITDLTFSLLQEFDLHQLNTLIELTEIHGLINLNEILNVIYLTTQLLDHTAFPLDKAFSILIQKQADESLQLCCSLYKIFRSKYDFDSILKNNLNSPQSIEKIHLIDSKINSGITRNLPIHKKTEEIGETEKFFKSIPSNFSVNNTPEQTLMANIHDTKTVFDLLNRFPSINIDDSLLMKVMEATIDNNETISNRTMNILNHFYMFIGLMRNPSELVILVFQQLIVLLSQLAVSDEDSEILAYESLLRIKKSFKSIQKSACEFIYSDQLIQHQLLNFPIQLNGKEQSTFTEVCLHIFECISIAIKFVSLNICTKFSIPYHFANFMKPQLGEFLVHTCFQLDYLDFAKEIATVYSLVFSNEQDEYALKIQQLGVDNNPQDINSNNSLYENGFIVSRLAADRTTVHSSDDHQYAQKFISAYRHRLFYDHEICARLVNISEIDLIIDNEFSSKEKNPETKLSLKNFFKQANNDDVDHEGNFHFYQRIKYLTRITEEEKVAIEEANKVALENQIGSDSFEQLDALLIFDFPSIDMSEIILPGTPALLARYLATRAPFYEGARYFGYIGEFEASLSVIESNQEKIENDEWDIFFNDIILPAIERGRIGQLFVVIQRAIKAEEEENVFSISFKQMMEKLLTISIDMPYTKLAVTITLGLLDQAAFSAIDIFKKAETNNERIIALDIAFALSVSYLKDNQSNESIMDLIKLIPLQKQFCQLFDASLNLFSGQANAESIVVFLILNSQFRLATQISLETAIDIIRVSDSITDIFANESDERVSKIINGLENNAPLYMVRQFILTMINRIVYLHSDERLLFVVISAVQTKSIKASLYLQYGQLEDAFNCAKDSESDLLPLIGHIASIEGKFQILQETVRLIEKGMKKTE